MKYNKYIGKSGSTWLVGTKNSDNHIYVSSSPHNRGFDGRVITFDLTDNTIFQLIGPWHSNNDALFEDTGIVIPRKSYKCPYSTSLCNMKEPCLDCEIFKQSYGENILNIKILKKLNESLYDVIDIINMEKSMIDKSNIISNLLTEISSKIGKL